MNILYLCADRGIPVRGHKGAAVHVRALTDALVAAGHRVTIFTPRPGPANGPAPLAEIVHCPLPGLADDRGDSSDWWRAAALPTAEAFTTPTAADQVDHDAYAATLTAAALSWLANQPCDAIYERYSLWSNVGARLRAATGLPFVLEVNAPLRVEAARHRQLDDDARAAQIEAAQFAAADLVAVVSQPLADYVSGRGADPARVHIVPNAVDPQHFHPAVRGGEVRERYGLHGRIVVGFAGRMRPWHDGPTLARAFARLYASNAAFHLLVVGETAPDFMAVIAAAGLTNAVTCTGPVPHSAVPEHLAAMDVAVSPHAAAEAGETFYFSPLKLFEYLACGAPTVAANVGQPAQLIQPGHNGYLYPPGDDAALAAAIQDLVADSARARTMAWNGAVQVLQKHTWARNAACVIDWLAARQAQAVSLRRAQVHGAGAPPNNGNGVGAPGKAFWQDTAFGYFANNNDNGVQAWPVSAVPSDAPALPLLDDKLRQRLYRATRADLAAPLLARQWPGFGKEGVNVLERIAEIEVLKYKPGRRCVLAYRLEGYHKPSGQAISRRVIGKVFRDERGQRLFRLQSRLWHACFGPSGVPGIGVPQPLAYVPEMRMLVQVSAPGLRLDELTLSGTIGVQAARCAEALAWLHRCTALLDPPADDPEAFLQPYTLADELHGLDGHMARLAEMRPDAVPAVRQLWAALLDWAAALPPAPRAVPLHRDFYYSQVLFDGEQLHLIDFDLLALGDPAIDVANFRAHLAYLGLEQFGGVDHFAAAMARFGDAYLRMGIVDAALTERVAFYEAATILRLLSVVAARPAKRHLFEPLLLHAQETRARCDAHTAILA